MGGKRDLRPAAAVAARQHGLITREQLLAAGITRRALDGLAADGWLQRVHTGVYAVGRMQSHPPARWLAATLATGAVLSHRSAAELWDLLPPSRGPVHVTRRSRDGSRRRAIVVHHAEVAPGERTRRRGVPCTSLIRTLCDLAGQVDARTLARAFDQAQVLHHLRPASVIEFLLDRPGRRGTTSLRELIADAVDPEEIESILELRFLEFCRKHGLPRPRTQVEFGPWRADFLFDAYGVVVETDSRRWHSTAYRRARDARKTAYLEARGLIVLRVWWHELRDDPSAVAARIRAAFDSSRYAFSPEGGEDAYLAH